MLPHLLGLELGVKDSQLCEHPHVSALQAKGSFQHSDQLLKVATVLREKIMVNVYIYIYIYEG